MLEPTFMKAQICTGTCTYRILKYHIVEKFGSDNVWQKWVDEDIDKKNLANW